jgi:hypothetical protein
MKERQKIVWMAAASESCTAKETRHAVYKIYRQTGLRPWDLYYDPELKKLDIISTKKKFPKMSSCEAAVKWAYDLPKKMLPQIKIIHNYSQDILHQQLYTLYLYQLEKNKTTGLCHFKDNKTDQYRQELSGI